MQDNCPAGMVMEHTKELTRMSMVLDAHSAALESLNTLSREFIRIKYALYGGVGLLLMQTLGFAEVFKRLVL